ncbi:MAG: hypothetical protein ACFFDN_22310 [Candidatus Hodarchaeota archaeon]
MSSKNILISLVIIFIAGCASQKSMYNKAYKANTVEAFEEFIQKYPEGVYAEQAKKLIQEIEFNKAKEINSIEAYNNYLKKYTEGEFSKEAKKEIEGIEFNNAKNINTIESYENFLERYPKGFFVDGANKGLQSIYATKIINSIGNDKMMLIYFEKFLKINNINNYFDYFALKNLVDSLIHEWQQNDKNIPKYSNKECFFYFFGDLSYIPTKDILEDDGIAIKFLDLIKSYSNIFKFYKIHEFEYAYILHNIGMINCTASIQKEPKDFSDIDINAITKYNEEASQRKRTEMYLKSLAAFSNSSREQNGKNLKKEMEKDIISDYELIKRLTETYRTAFLTLYTILDVPNNDYQTKVFILERLSQWVKIIKMDEKLKNTFNNTILSVSKKSDNKIKRLAKIVTENCIK